MNERDAIDIIRNHARKQFPKECSCCKKRWSTFAEFIRSTSYVGKPVSYDAEMGIFKPIKPLGTLGMVNCLCGSTIALSSKGMKLITMWKLLRWGRKEAKNRGCTSSDILADLRNEIDEIELREEVKD
jgi:hypothetical protein